MTELDAVDVYAQLKDLKRLVAYLMIGTGRREIRVPMNLLDQIPDNAEIIVWPELLSLELNVVVRGVPPIDGIDIADAEVVDEPSDRAALRRALEDPDSVIVLNGDGTVHEIRELTEGEKNAPFPPLGTALTFHHEPHPELPGVVVPVLDQAVRHDPATGAIEW